jgi:hypothetical protein
MKLFELEALGPPPYRFLFVHDLKKLGRHGHCQCCGQKIRFEFWFRASDGHEFFVGSVCFLKSTDEASPIATEVKKAARAAAKRAKVDADPDQKRTMKERVRNALLCFYADRELLTDRRHPFSVYAAQGLTTRDYVSFVFKKARDQIKLAAAVDTVETAWKNRNERLADEPGPAE